MRQTSLLVTAILIVGASIMTIYMPWQKGSAMSQLPHVVTSDQLQYVFPQDTHTLAARTESIIDTTQREIQQIISRGEDTLTFENTIQAFDRMKGALESWGASLHVLHMASPDADIRSTAYNKMLEIEQFAIENIEYNVALYKQLKACGQRLLATDIADHRERYIRHLLDDFVKRGLDLPEEKRQQAMDLSKQLVQKAMQFDANINQDDSHILATREQLAGLEDSFIDALEMPQEGQYKLGTDYPTYHRVMENCQVADTRYRLWRAFTNRAYPANRDLLKEIIALRDQFAQLVGYTDYAHLDIDEEEMAESPENVRQFLDEMLHRSQDKWKHEFQELTRDVPESVTLDERGRLKPWDVAFVKNAYKKQHYAVDETELMEYFPLDYTLQQLLSIYEQFFGVSFTRVPADHLWHEDLRCVQVYYGDTLMGHIVMDLFPRENKFSHAAQIGVVPRYQAEDGTHPGVVFLVANFPKPKQDQPALLKRDDVEVFFHEFGHVLHSLFGATELIGQAGTHVPTDFVELPSQMLEEWLYDTQILKDVSQHYTSGDPLPDDLIDRIQKLKTFDPGYFVQRQVALSRMSLQAFAQGEEKDPDELYREAASHLHDYIMPSDENNFYAAFGHLTGYGAKYYSYLWSKVYAIDVFTYINAHGLYNQEVGQRYARNVLMQGNSMKPMQMLENFLGRSPQREAFYRYYHFT